jgi:hypothetical protein
MKRYLQVMAVLIALQLIVSVMVMWPNSDGQRADARLIDIDPAQIATIELSDGQNNQLSLKKNGSEWRIQQGDMSALANAAQVDNLLQALMTSPAGWPVSTSEDALSRFAVADTDYQWKITLATLDNARNEILYFGNSAGVAKRHARRSGDFTVYALNYALADKFIKVRDWVKRDILAIANEDIVKIDAGDYVLQRDPGQGGESGWLLADQRSDEIIDQELVAMFLGRLNSLRIDDVVTGELLTKINAEKPVQTISVSTNVKDAPVRRFIFYKWNDKNYISRDDIKGVYEISLLAASDLLKLRNQWLIPGKVIAPQKQAE